MNEELLLMKKLDALRAQHRELDEKLKMDYMDDFTRQRFKKMKLEMRTEISRIEQLVYPDIIA